LFAVFRLFFIFVTALVREGVIFR